MTVYGLDSFTKANQSGWGSAAVGGSWTLVRSNQTLSIVSNQGVMANNGSATTGIVQLGSTLVNDSMMLVRATQGTNVTDIIGICPRFQNTSNFYEFVQGSTSGQFQLRKNVAGTFSTVVGVAFTSVVGTAYWIRCQVIGTSFFGKIWQDGTAEPNTWMIGALGITDTSVAGPQGFGLVGAPQTAGSNVKFDNFYAVDTFNSDDLSAGDALLSMVETTPLDALSASQTLLVSGESLSTDALSALENFLVGASFVPVDQLSVSDIALAQVEFFSLDALTALDLFAPAQSWQPVNALSALSKLLSTDTYTTIDQLSSTDTSTMVSAPPLAINVIMLARKGTVTLYARKGSAELEARKGTVTLYGRTP